ncbi:MAG TPA: Gfo/Idh/MocA family oxidoreductase [Trueperaceae bacterium]
MSEELGVLIVGAGEMGARHAGHWREAGARVMGVFDPDTLRADALASLHGGTAVRTLDEALSLDAVGVVSVCTPTFLHANFTIASLRAGKHVLCEKPAALTLAEALAMKEAEEASGKLLRIGFMRRFDPATHQLRRFAAGIGSPLLAQATIAAGVRPKLMMHDAAANGGPIIDMCCHVFDLWALLFGEAPALVRAHGYTFSEHKPQVAAIRRKALDSAHLTLAYPGGSVGQIQVSWGLPSGIAPIERHTYMAPEGLVTVEWPSEVTLHDGHGTTRWSTRGEDPWRAQIAAFAAEIAGLELAPGGSGTQAAVDPRPVLATIDDGIAALRVSLAAIRSVEGRCDVGPAELEPEPQMPLTGA